MTTQSTLVATGDIIGENTAGYQVLQTTDVTLTATQFQGFSSIVSGTGTGGYIYAATGGVYDLEGKSTEDFNLVAQSNAGTTLIADDASGETLIASATGADTLQAGNGADDVLIGGGGADRFVLSNTGSATVHGGTGSNVVVFSGDEANYVAYGSFTNRVLTTTVTNKTTGAVDTLTNVQDVQFADASTTAVALDGGVVGLLSDPTVKAAVASVLSNNSISYQGMLTVLDDVAAQGAVTSSEFSSLQTLVSLLNVSGGISVSPCVQNIATELVDGNAANAYWTGGASAVSLGNLAAGSSATQLNELIDKWFLGTDLPSLASFSNIAYQTDSSALFGPGGVPLYTNANQGEVGDCYLIASIGECALLDPSLVESMITNNGNGTYGVRFFVDGQADYVTVNLQLPYFTNNLQWANGSKLAFANGSPMWAELIEKAFVELNAEPGVTGEPVGNAYQDIAGGDAEPVTLITGKTTNDYSKYPPAKPGALGI